VVVYSPITRSHNLQNHMLRKPEHQYPGSNSRILCTSNICSFTDTTDVFLTGYQPRQTGHAQAITFLKQWSPLHSPRRHLQPRPEAQRTCHRPHQAVDRLQHKCNVSPHHAVQHLRHSLPQSVAMPMQPLHPNSPRRHLQPRPTTRQQPKQPLRAKRKVGAPDLTRARGKLFIQVERYSNQQWKDTMRPSMA